MLFDSVPSHHHSLQSGLILEDKLMLIAEFFTCPLVALESPAVRDASFHMCL